MEQQNPYDPYHPTRNDTNASSMYSQRRTASASSTVPLRATTQQSQEEPTLGIQHSATFYPSAQDDYFTNMNPYGGNWDTGDFVTTPPPITPPEQPPSRSRTRSLHADSASLLSGPVSQPDTVLSRGIGRSPSVGTPSGGIPSAGIPSPPGGPAIYTPSTGSSTSASSPQRQASTSISLPPPSVPSFAVDTSYVTVDHITSPVPTTWRSSVGSVPERNVSTSYKPVGRTAIKASRLSKGNMLPVQEDEVLSTEEKGSQMLGPMVYSDETGGWVRRAKTSVKSRSGNLMRSLTRKLTTYKPISGEDQDVKKLDRAQTIKNDEECAEGEGYVGFDADMFGGFDSPVPERTADAMRNTNGNTDFAYTATGEVVDLSSLQGLGADEDVIDDDGKSRRDSFSLTRATTGFTSNEKSYYFPEDPDTPNWKPFTMGPVYLTILQFLALCIIGFCEYLYQYSVQRGKDTGYVPHLTKFSSLQHMPLMAFALWKYLPTVIAVVFGVLVQVADDEIKRVEPYFQLSRKPKGALAADSLNIEYLGFWAILCPLQAFRHRHWAVLASSIAGILAFAAVPPLQSAFLNLDPDKAMRKANPEIMKFITVDKVWTRLLEAVMFLIFILIAVLQWILLRRKTGLVGDPSGIAGVAAMANRSHILMDFKGLDLAGTKLIHKQLRKRTYILHKSSLWQAEFLKESERPDETVRDQNAHPLLLRLEGGVPLMFYLLVVMVTIPVFMYKPDLQKVLATSTWTLTALSISIKMFWDAMDRELRTLQPFYLLWKRKAPSDVLTLDYTGTIPGWIIYKTICHKHYLLTYITSISLLNELLTVCLGSLDPMSGEETSRSQKISLILAEAIILAQIIGMGVVLYLRRQPFLPRQPGTISSVLAFIYASRMLPDFDNMETKSTTERSKMLAAKGKTYGFGWFKGLIDGKWHLGIDQEELMRSYKYGDRFLDSVVQGVPSGLDRF